MRRVPFASTTQSGPQLYGALFVPALCTVIQPVYNGGFSYTNKVDPGYSASQRCEIGHIAVADNTDVGTQLSDFYTTNRVLDAEAFWVDEGP